MKLFSIFIAVIAGVLLVNGNYILAVMALICALYDQKGLLFE